MPVEQTSPGRRFQIEFDGEGSIPDGLRDQSGRRMDLPGRTDRDEQSAGPDRIKNVVEIQGDLPEPDDPGPHPADLPADRASGPGSQIDPPLNDTQAALATGLQELTVHMDHLATAAAFMEIIGVLGHKKKPAGPGGLETGQRAVGRIGLHLKGKQPAATGIVEIMHPVRVPGKCLRRRQILDPHPGPDSVRVAECLETLLARDSGTCQNDEVTNGKHNRLITETRRSTSPRIGETRPDRSRSPETLLDSTGSDRYPSGQPPSTRPTL